jgi:hypothetical protein
MTADYRMEKQTTIAAGKSADFVLTALRYGKRDSSRWLLTAPAQYPIKLSFLTHLSKNSVKGTSNEITLEVKE